MSKHYCIGSPCWICHPEHAPRQGEKLYDFWQQEIKDHHIPEIGISGIVKDALVEIFKAGLDEGAHHWAPRHKNIEFSSDMLIKEIKNLKDGMIEAELLNLLIEAFKHDEEWEKRVK